MPYIYCILLGHPEGYKHFTASNSVVNLPYTRVNKYICLFPKLQGEMRLLPIMRLIMKAKIDQSVTPLW